MLIRLQTALRLARPQVPRRLLAWLERLEKLLPKLEALWSRTP